ncbi:MAG: hypothetical protein PUI24_05395 [Spirochaetales bacterium]|nr:hypothetical protein [Spirochaetales bacterium]
MAILIVMRLKKIFIKTVLLLAWKIFASEFSIEKSGAENFSLRLEVHQMAFTAEVIPLEKNVLLGFYYNEEEKKYYIYKNELWEELSQKDAFTFQLADNKSFSKVENEKEYDGYMKFKCKVSEMKNLSFMSSYSFSSLSKEIGVQRVFLPEVETGTLFLVFARGDKKYILTLEFNNAFYRSVKNGTLDNAENRKFLSQMCMETFCHKDWMENLYTSPKEYTLKVVKKFFDDKQNIFQSMFSGKSEYKTESFTESDNMAFLKLLADFYENKFTKTYQVESFLEPIISITKNSASFNKENIHYSNYILPDLNSLTYGDLVIVSDKKNDLIDVAVLYPSSKIKNTELSDLKITDIGKVSALSIHTNKIELIPLIFFVGNKNSYFVRLTKQTKEKKSGKSDNMIDMHIENSSLTIKNYYESSQTDRKKWKFIPNTGEFLILDDFELKVSNAGGADLSFYFKENLSIELSDAWDWNVFYEQQSYKKRKAVYETKDEFLKNNSDEFEIVFFDNKRRILGKGILRRLDGSSISYTFIPSNERTLHLKLNSENIIVYENGEHLRIGIRNLEPETFAPGDDLLLTFKLTLKNGIEKNVSCNSDCFVSTYDKKMLWRGNLYINESVDSKASDWNNVHLWNVPVSDSEGKISSVLKLFGKKTIEPFWTSKWGYNQWNWKFSLFDDLDNLADPSSESGNQTVQFPEYTPFRQLGSYKNHKSVSYDYNYEDEQRAWDSPFDFIYKLKKQSDCLREHFLETTKKKLLENSELRKKSSFIFSIKSSTASTTSASTASTTSASTASTTSASTASTTSASTASTTSASTASTTAASTTSTTDTSAAVATASSTDTNKGPLTDEQILAEKGAFPYDGEKFIKGNEHSLYELSLWKSCLAPNNVWKFYWKENGTENKAYIPSLGFSLYMLKNSEGDDTSYWGGTTSENLENMKFPSRASAGTDCIGFAFRAANYEGNNYKWTSDCKMPKDIGEGNRAVDEEIRTLAYPSRVPDSCSEIITWLDLNNSNDLQELQFYTIKPGESELCKILKEEPVKVESTEENSDGSTAEKTILKITEKDIKVTGPSPEDFDFVKRRVLSIVPGDVVVYGAYLLKNNLSEIPRDGAHIGIVSDIDYSVIDSAKNYFDLMGGIEVIESVYSSYSLGVLKRKMNESSTGSAYGFLKSKVYNNWLFRTEAVDLKKVYRPWSIQRLKKAKKD